MGKYHVTISDQARQDLHNLSNTIVYEYKSPQTAVRYLKGIYRVIKQLQYSAGFYQIQTRPSLQQYGINVRRINYKKMAIIYTVHARSVYIHRIIPQNTIGGL